MTDYSMRLSSEEYKKIYQHEIDIFNNSINKTRIIIDMTDNLLLGEEILITISML